MSAGSEIAIIGMACRLPGAADLDALWRLLDEGREGVRDLTESDLLANGIPAGLLRDPAYVRRAAVVEGQDMFSPQLFGLSAPDAERMDPQHRMFLETVWEALEHAALAPRSRRGRVGIYAGAGFNAYLQHNLLPRGALSGTNGFSTLVLNMPDFLVTRAAYALDFTGPAVNVQSACSSSLLAVHLACQGLLAGEADIALAGGVSLSTPQEQGYLYQPGMIFSPDGHCRPFDALANGFVPGNGCGVVVLRLLEDALADGDPVLAVLRGTAANNDGARKVGFTAPSAEGQAAAIAEAWEVAGLAPDTAGLVEAHGTGTAMGDPIEVQALKRVFTGNDGRVALGSIKSNIGHADAAAGVAGLIKAVLCLRHRRIVPSLHFHTPNPALGLEGSAFHVPTASRPWPAGNEPRRAGVSAFGFGGTNVHAVLEEAPRQDARPTGHGSSRRVQVFPLSAAEPEALNATTARLADALAEGASPEAAAWTLQHGREALAYRRAETVSDLGVLARVLATPRHVRARPGRPAAFLFTGQGGQHPGMLAGLYATEPLFRAGADRMLDALREGIGLDLRAWLAPGAALDPALAAALEDTTLVQPLLFIQETSLAGLWRGLNLRPRAMLGHSIGELAAACVAGVLTPEEGALFAARRGRLMAAAPAGAMLAVALDEDSAREFLAGHPDLDLAAVNGPNQCVLSGPVPAVDAAQTRCGDLGIACARLAVARAFHSRLMEPAAEALERTFAEFSPREPVLPWLSNVSGDWITPEQARAPAYWRAHACQTVRFAPALERLLAEPDTALLELGPVDTLARLARSHPSHRPEQPVFASQPRLPAGPAVSDEAVGEALGRTIAGLWECGVDLDWAGLHGDTPPVRVNLPSTAFPRRRFWLEPPAAGATPQPDAGDFMPVKRPNPADWLYAPVWTQCLPPAGGDGAEAVCVLGNDTPAGRALEECLRAAGRRTAALATAETVDARRLANALAALPGPQPTLFLDPRPLTLAPGSCGEDEALETLLFRPVELAKALADLGWTACRLVTASLGGWRVLGSEPAWPWPGLALAAAKLLPLEHPELSCAVADLDPALADDWPALADSLLRAAQTPAPAEPWREPLTAWRNGKAWRRDYAQLAASSPAPESPSLRRGGVYLITGGLGGVGLTLARYLAERLQARLILLSRRPAPQREDWAALAAGQDPTLAHQGGELAAIAAAATTLRLVQADVADPDGLVAALDAARAELGPINGCLHCAGLADYAGLAQRRGRSDTLEVLRPKVRGSLTLIDALGDDPLDFLLLFSSLGDILFPTKFGQIGYAAACEFQDSLAEALHEPGAGGPRVLAVNWDDWTGAGMSVNAEEHLRKMLGHAPEPLVGLDAAEGGAALELVLHTAKTRDLPRMAVCVRDLDRLRHHLPERTPPAGGVLLPRPDLGTQPVPPADSAEAELAALWAEALGLETVGAEDDFLALGGHSLLAISLCSRITAAFGTPFPPGRLLAEATVRRCAAHLQAARAARQGASDADGPSAPRLTVLRQGEADTPPLFLLHASDGDSLSYIHLAGLLPRELPLICLASPGLDDPVAPLPDSLEDMAAIYLRAMRARQPRGPYRLAGLSMGGVLAFEMTRQLAEAGEEILPPLLLDAYCPAGSGMNRGCNLDVDELLSGQGVPEDCAELMHPRDPARRRVVAANLRALYAYRPGPLAVPVVLIKAAEQSLNVSATPDLGWEAFCTAGLEIAIAPGDHFTVMRPPNVAETARAMLAALARTARKTPAGDS